MLFLVIILSCMNIKFNAKEKGIREDISEAIANPDCESSKAVLKKVNRYTASYKNSEGLLPIEEAIAIKSIEAIKLLIDVEGCQYPYRVYEKMLDTKSLEIFNLIPQNQLTYRLLLRIKENKDRELEEEFLKRIEATELEEFIVEGRVEEIKSKDKAWILSNYRDERGFINQRRINTTEILFIYSEDIMEDMIEKLKEEKEDIKEYMLLTASKLGRKSVYKKHSFYRF